MTDQMLPAVDTPPDHWGPDHDGLALTADEIEAGNKQGEAIDVDDDEDNGL